MKGGEEMFCSKCGAAVVGKFCSCCGARVRSQIEEYHLAEKRAVKAFKDACVYRNGRFLGLERLHLAEACWLAASFKYGWRGTPGSDGSVPARAFEMLDNVRTHAELLFNQLLLF